MVSVNSCLVKIDCIDLWMDRTHKQLAVHIKEYSIVSGSKYLKSRLRCVCNPLDRVLS